MEPTGADQFNPTLDEQDEAAVTSPVQPITGDRFDPTPYMSTLNGRGGARRVRRLVGRVTGPVAH